MAVSKSASSRRRLSSTRYGFAFIVGAVPAALLTAHVLLNHPLLSKSTEAEQLGCGLQVAGAIQIADVLPGPWKQVCIIGAYSWEAGEESLGDSVSAPSWANIEGVSTLVLTDPRGSRRILPLRSIVPDPPVQCLEGKTTYTLKRQASAADLYEVKLE
jgi:hypothetical protein